MQRFKGVGNVWRDPKRGLGGGWVTQAKPESGEGLAFAVSDDLRSWKLAGVQAALPECAGESSLAPHSPTRGHCSDSVTL